jgi:hypothetical protein
MGSGHMRQLEDSPATNPRGQYPPRPHSTGCLVASPRSPPSGMPREAARPGGTPHPAGVQPSARGDPPAGRRRQRRAPAGRRRQRRAPGGTPAAAESPGGTPAAAESPGGTPAAAESPGGTPAAAESPGGTPAAPEEPRRDAGGSGEPPAGRRRERRAPGGTPAAAESPGGTPDPAGAHATLSGCASGGETAPFAPLARPGVPPGRACPGPDGGGDVLRLADATLGESSPGSRRPGWGHRAYHGSGR